MSRFARAAAVWCAAALIACSNAEGQKVQEIKFDLGKNIVDTARLSGVPQFQVADTNGLIRYSVNSIPKGIAARFTRSGHEVAVEPLFAFRLSANRKQTPDDLVYRAGLQIDDFTSHGTAQAFVEQLQAQFAKGKWKRHLNEYCPAVTGRSSWLNAAGALNLEDVVCPDPDYRLTRDEWLVVMRGGQQYRWVGGGVIAELRVTYGDNPATGVVYDMFLEFELEAVQQQRLVQAEADRIREGEAKGWGMAAKVAAGKKESAALNKLLEANALKRGDRVVARE